MSDLERINIALVPPKDVIALTDALVKLTANEQMCKQMGSAARQRSTAFFDARKVNNSLIAEYIALLQEYRRGNFEK